MAKEKSRARHAWLYQAEEEFEKVPWGAGAEAPSVGWGGVPEPEHSAWGLSDPLFSFCDAEAER